MGEVVKGPGAKDNAPPFSLPERAEDLTAEHVKQALLALALSAKDEMARVKALELLGQTFAMFKQVIIYRVEAAGDAEWHS